MGRYRVTIFWNLPGLSWAWRDIGVFRDGKHPARVLVDQRL